MQGRYVSKVCQRTEKAVLGEGAYRTGMGRGMN